MHVCEFRTVEPDPYFILSASVSSARAVTGSWRAASQTAEMTNRGWKVWELQQSLAPPPLTYSTPTAEMSQHNHRKPSPLQLCKLGEWCKSDASAKPASLQGGHLGGVCQPRSKRQELRPTRRDPASCGSGREGLAVPAGRCQRRGNQAGCLAAWLSGWQGGGAVGSEITLHRCANSSSAQHLCPHPRSSIPPLRSTAGLTDACKSSRGQCAAPRSLKSDQNNHRWLRIGGWGGGVGCAGFLKLRWGILQFTKRLQLWFDDRRRHGKNAARRHSKLHH